MDSVQALSMLLAREQTIDSPRKLQTVLFLAQEATGEELYRFRLSRGKVLSDELDQDVGRLEAAGVLVHACSLESHKWTLQVSRGSAFTAEIVDELEGFFDVAQRLFRQPSEVLEGAASLCRFDRRENAEAVHRLAWFQGLNEKSREQAEELCREVASQRE